MKVSNVGTRAVAVLALCLCAPWSRGDGDGPDRAVTAAEKAFASKTLGVIAGALPAPPAGWKEVEKPSTAAPGKVFEGVEKGSMRLSYKGKWLDQGQKDRQGRKVQDAVMKSASSGAMESMDQDMGTLQEEQQKIMEEMMQAAQKQDQAGMAKAQKKLAALQQKQRRATNGFAAPVEAAAASAAPQDACLEVTVEINQTTVGLVRTKPLKVPGAERAFLLGDGDKGRRDCPYGRAVVVLGAWDKGRVGGDYLYLKSNWRDGMPHTSVKNMLVSVRAGEARTKEYLGAVKWDELAGLLAK